jgi:FKBP-type peptidyl-prolyl cis-trans isomerase
MSLRLRLREAATIGQSEFMSAQAYHNEQLYGLEEESRRAEQLEAAVKTAERQLEARTAQSEAEAMREIEEADRQLEAIGQELLKARDLSAKQAISSPVKGTVKGLAANTIGGGARPDADGDSPVRVRSWRWRLSRPISTPGTSRPGRGPRSKWRPIRSRDKA